MKLSKIVTDIRVNWAIADAKRDEGLTTPQDIVRRDNLSYGPYDEWNMLDIYYPQETARPLPTIVSVHGGAWVYGTKEVYQFYCMSLAQRGFTVVNFNYRLAPENKYPTPLFDINQVFCFLKEKGEEYFRNLETAVIRGILCRYGQSVCCRGFGRGTACQPVFNDLLKSRICREI